MTPEVTTESGLQEPLVPGLWDAKHSNLILIRIENFFMYQKLADAKGYFVCLFPWLCQNNWNQIIRGFLGGAGDDFGHLAS